MLRPQTETRRLFTKSRDEPCLTLFCEIVWQIEMLLPARLLAIIATEFLESLKGAQGEIAFLVNMNFGD